MGAELRTVDPPRYRGTRYGCGGSGAGSATCDPLPDIYHSVPFAPVIAELRMVRFRLQRCGNRLRIVGRKDIERAAESVEP
jgi:hypothetical protein